MAASGVLIPNTACDTGIMWGTTLRVQSGSRISVASPVSNTEETVLVQLYDGVVGACSLPAYGIGMGPASLEGFMTYRAGTVKSSAFGHKWYLAGENAMRLTASGILIIGGSGTTNNANMQVGLTINDDSGLEMLALKANSTAHGMTAEAETNTVGAFKRGGVSGLRIEGYSDDSAAATANHAILLEANIGLTAGDTTKSTTGYGMLVIEGKVRSGTGTTTPGANENLVVIRSNATTRFIFDSDGDSHQDVGTAWTNFDEWADAELLTALSVYVSRQDDPVRSQFGEFLAYNREALERAKLVAFNDDGHHFVNMSRLSMLLTGAVRQLSACLTRIEGSIEERIDTRFRQLTSGSRLAVTL